MDKKFYNAVVDAMLNENFTPHEILNESIEIHHPGAFHRWLGKAEEEPITDADIQKGLDSSDEHVRKMAEFAKVARHWHKK